MPYFFFSYASENADDDLTRFLEDLRSIICEKTGCTKAEACFNDWDQRPGEDYTQNIPNALATSRVMVSVYSAHYFGRPYCGKEFQVFLDRRKAYKEKNPASKPTCMIPIIWVPVTEPFTVPEFFVSRDKSSAYEVEYVTHGLKQIFRQGVNLEGGRRDWYVDFTRRTADEILDCAAKFRLPPAPANLDMMSVKNAFDARRPDLVADPAAMKWGPNSATFLYVGNEDWEWDSEARYVPPLHNRAGFVSCAVAVSKEIEPQRIKFEPNSGATFALLDKLHELQSRVVVLVDRQAVEDDAHRNWLVQYGQRPYRHCATLVVGEGGVAPGDVGKVFGNRTGDLFFNDIPNAKELGLKIKESLEALRIQLSNTGSSNVPGSRLPSF